ncbi:hypothetical protein IJ750_07025 [bacterium]|nr:hypothetical protein [bacterium]
MKRNLLLVLALFIAIGIPANAKLTVEESTSPEYLINNGYSEATAEEIMIMKNRINGKPAEPLYDKKSSKFARFWRNVYGYIDPSIDTDERIHHDIHMSPNYKDL